VELSTSAASFRDDFSVGLSSIAKWRYHELASQRNSGVPMTDFILFMHDDVPQGRQRPDGDWETYFAKLREFGAFQGGSAIGGGVCASKSSPPAAITGHIAGYIRIRAENLESARELLVGNPVYEAGGTVEIRELPRTG
jgi:hypothetical protein